MKPHLLDLNMLIALAWPSHVFHELAHDWFRDSSSSGWATCPMTQCGFVRISSNPAIISDAVAPRDALALLRMVTELDHHNFWSDDLDLTDSFPVSFAQVVGHRQVTDAYLVGVAVRNNGKLATLDRKIASLFPDDKAASRVLTLVI